MDNELKKEIKKLLLLTSFYDSTSSISKVLDDVEEELEEILGKDKKKIFDIEEWLQIKKLK